MTTVPESVLLDIASRVAERVAGERSPVRHLPARFVLLVISGGEDRQNGMMGELSGSGESIIAVVDNPETAAGAVASALGRVPSLEVAGEGWPDAAELVGRAERVVAPGLDLGLASRVASLQPDTPGARALVRALVSGVPVEATLDPRDFDVSERAPDGARRAVAAIVARLGELGVALRGAALPPHNGPSRFASTPVAQTPAAAYGAGGAHPSLDKFTFPESVHEFVDFLEKKACSMEAGKPCVDCGACESRGF